MFPALRFLNASHNRLFGDVSEQWGNTGLFTLPPLLNNSGWLDAGIIAHVFSLSYNALTGSIPGFLYSENLQGYQSLGIELAVSTGPMGMELPVSKLEARLTCISGRMCAVQSDHLVLCCCMKGCLPMGIQIWTLQYHPHGTLLLVM